MWGSPRALDDGVRTVEHWDALCPGTWLTLGELPRAELEPPFLDALHAEVWYSFRRSFSADGRPHPLGIRWGEQLTVWGFNALVADAAGRPFSALHWHHPRLWEETLQAMGIRADDAPRLAPARHLAGPCVLLAGPWHWNYYHWMVDVLSKAVLLSPLFSVTELNWLTPPLDALRRESLSRLGVPLERVIELTPERWQVDSLLLATPAAPYLSVNRSHIQAVRQALLRKRLPPFRRIYVSRADAGSRKVCNEDALLSMLEPLGFSAVHLTGMEAEAQWALFARAEVVIAPHGAGLSNLMFCAPGTLVIELMPIHHASFVFFELCRALDLNYLFLLGYPEEAQAAPSGAGFRVDVSALQRLVTSLLI